MTNKFEQIKSSSDHSHIEMSVTQMGLIRLFDLFTSLATSTSSCSAAIQQKPFQWQSPANDDNLTHIYMRTHSSGATIMIRSSSINVLSYAIDTTASTTTTAHLQLLCHVLTNFQLIALLILHMRTTIWQTKKRTVERAFKRSQQHRLSSP